MKIIETQVRLFLPPPRTPRTPGIHVSGVIRAIAIEAGILPQEWTDDLSLCDVREIKDEVALLRISIGLAWEEWYIPQILGPELEVVDHPGEYCVDGIYCSPDGESLSCVFTDNKYRLTMHEVKATYKSTNTVGDVRGEWLWLTQIKAYCKARGTRFAMLHVLFLCGDYKFPITPQLKHWAIEFEQEEIDDNMQFLADYRDEKINGTR